MGTADAVSSVGVLDSGFIVLNEELSENILIGLDKNAGIRRSADNNSMMQKCLSELEEVASLKFAVFLLSSM